MSNNEKAPACCDEAGTGRENAFEGRALISKLAEIPVSHKSHLETEANYLVVVERASGWREGVSQCRRRAESRTGRRWEAAACRFHACSRQITRWRAELAFRCLVELQSGLPKSGKVGVS